MVSFYKRLRRFSILFLAGFTLWLLLETKLSASFVSVVQRDADVGAAKSLSVKERKLELWGLPSQAVLGNEGVDARIPQHPIILQNGNNQSKETRTKLSSIALAEIQASSLNSSLLVQQGLQLYEAGKVAEAIHVWQQALSQISQPLDRAALHNNLALAYRQIGNLNEALQQWEQAIQIYRSHKDETGQQRIAQLLTEQGQTYNDLGQQQRAIQLLQSALKLARENHLSLTEVAALGALGNAYWTGGSYEQAIASIEASLKMAREFSGSESIVKNLMASGLNSLGNIYASRAERYRYQANASLIEGDEQEANRFNDLAQKDIAAAIIAFEQSAEQARTIATDQLAEVRALLNLNRLLGRMSSPNLDLIKKNQERVLFLLEKMPDSRDKAYALINLATPSPSAPLSSRARGELLGRAIASARSINDTRAESFALGSLGQLYEEAGQYTQAMELTQQAEFAAQKTNAADSLYRWQWQAGRIFKVTGDRTRAIASYEGAIATLQSIRSDILATNKELQFNFRDSVEPVYRELIALLLETGNRSSVMENGKQAQPLPMTNSHQNLQKVLNIIDLLKLAELQNFFGDECVEIAQENAKNNGDLVKTGTAVIYSVILSDRAEMILQSPDGNLKGYLIQIEQDKLQQEIDQLRLVLENRATEEYLTQAQKIYDLLIRPMAADITQLGVKTLVFIQDGVLRKVPMSALHDGQEFLVQKYAIATTPSLSLTASQSLAPSNLKALAVGLTVERPPFPPLTNVAAEVAEVKSILGGIELLDRDFTINRLEQALKNNNFPIIHMATHGKFGVDATTTFLVGYDERISLAQLENLLRIVSQNYGRRERKQPVELLTLSACQTAAGDNRSALGIAGVAVRAGVKSALASLWFINDEATVRLIEEFYTQLRQPNITKAEALRQAQVKLIASEDYNHPAVWSPFILIGNWL